MRKIPSKYCVIIDDDAEDQELFLIAAQEVNPDVICKCERDAEQALALLKKSPETPDFIFLDINMPKMDGFEFIKLLKSDERLQKIPVIFYSTATEMEYAQKAKQLGASGFVTKTTNYADLCNLLRMFLN